MAIEGYKAFHHDMSNNYGMKFEVGKTYHVDGPIKFGVDGNGFHLCTNVEDTFRYVEDDEVKVAKVIGDGTIADGFDDYNEYYDMYAVSDLTVSRLMIRDEIIEEVLKGNEFRVCRFISTGFMLNENERQLIRDRFPESRIINNCVDYVERVRYPLMKVKK
jgi:hypothetical protein